MFTTCTLSTSLDPVEPGFYIRSKPGRGPDKEVRNDEGVPKGYVLCPLPPLLRGLPRDKDSTL